MPGERAQIVFQPLAGERTTLLGLHSRHHRLLGVELKPDEIDPLDGLALELSAVGLSERRGRAPQQGDEHDEPPEKRGARRVLAL